MSMPLTQHILADLLGLSVVHVNRTLAKLRSNGLIGTCRTGIAVIDPLGLAEIAEMEPEFTSDMAPAPRHADYGRAAE